MMDLGNHVSKKGLIMIFETLQTLLNDHFIFLTFIRITSTYYS